MGRILLILALALPQAFIGVVPVAAATTVNLAASADTWMRQGYPT